MNKFAFFLAAATSTLLIGATSTAAFAAPGAAYRLTPVAAVAAADTVVANDVLWKKVGENYVGTKPSGSRPAIVCAQAVKKIGKVEAFEANGQAFDAEALAKCNEKAR